MPISPGVPALHPPPGRYAGDLTITLRPTNPRAEIVFTLDGTAPDAEIGTLYTRPLRLTAQGITTLRAVEVVGGQTGPERVASYAIGVEGKLPLLSLALPPESLWDAERGLLANPTWRGAEWERVVQGSYLSPAGEVAFALPAGLRVAHEGAKPDLRLYFRSEYGEARLSYPLFPAHREQAPDVQSYKRLVLQGGQPGREALSGAGWTLSREALAAESARAVGLRAVQGRAVHLFVNGESWGLYRLVERVDRFSLADNYGYTEADVVREGKAEVGDDEAWDDLVDWATTHDLAEPEHYAYLQARVDVAQFIDAALLYHYFHFPADALLAVRPRLGRWGWLYAGGGELPTPVTTAADSSDLAQLFTALLANAHFRRAYATRAADLLNTALSPPAIAARVAALDRTWRADYGYERGRWFYGAPWAEEVTALHTWAAQRADQLRAQVAERTGVAGSVPLSLIVEPPGKGQLYANGMHLNLGQGVSYFAGTTVTLTAVPVRWPLPGYRFTGWTLCEDGSCREMSGASELPLLVNATRAPSVTAHFAPCALENCRSAANDVIISEFWINDNGTRYSSLGGRALVGDWVELRVLRAGVDLRGWRLTDNDHQTGSAEGSLIFPQHPALASLPRRTVILVVATQDSANAHAFPQDDLDPRDRRLLFYVGNGNLDTGTDPGFGIGRRDDNLVLLAPGASADFADDVGVDFVAEGDRVTPHSFGVLADGVVFPTPFRFLGADDGASWLRRTHDPDAVTSWRVDPPACQSGDALCWGERNQVTPGR